MSNQAPPIAAVSVSGGKDSTATLLLAIERLPKERIFPVMSDTGNEHPITYDYVKYLENALNIAIKIVKEDFSEWWWERRDYIRDKWQVPSPKKGWPDGVPADIIARVLKVFEKGPTGNPYLDLCIIKGRFPSRKAQFCTDFLKKQPLNRYINDLVTKHGVVESWQGVRADESESRSKLPERETFKESGEVFDIYRPILRWNVEMVFDQHRKSGIDPNPLYKLGMNRVGCMPCINCSKDELLEISKRFPEHIERIAEWERCVSDASKRGYSTFIPTAPRIGATARSRTSTSGSSGPGRSAGASISASSATCRRSPARPATASANRFPSGLVRPESVESLLMEQKEILP